MRFYIADDDINVVKMLINLIEDYQLGEVIGSANDGETALHELKVFKPDIVLMDYLMPKMDGATVIKHMDLKKTPMKFIFISQVSDKGMIADTYLSGSEFFITKPLNSIEINRVIKSVIEKIELEKTIKSVQKIIGKTLLTEVEEERFDQLAEIKKVLSHIGILGEKGSYDLIRICEYIIEEALNKEPLNLTAICKALGENPKIMKQRIRRSVYSGLSNIAHSGIEDYMNDYFIKYSGSLYDFENVKAEMDSIRGKRKTGGKVSLEKFVENLILQSEEKG